MKKKFFLFILIFFCINSITIGQFNIPKQPKKIYPVQDYAKILSKEQINKINKKLILYSKTTSTEILVTIIQDLHKEDPNLLANKWGEKWKIGNIYKNNGIVILLSINDKKISIQNGYGIEPYMTDFVTMKIIKKIKPILKNHLYYKAIDCSIEEIFKILKNKYHNTHNKNKKIFSVWFYIMSFIFVLFFIFLYKNRIIDSSFLNTLFIINFLFKNNNNNWENNNWENNNWENNNWENNNWENEDNFDGFGEGGNFGGGGSSSNW
ncbi:TPM domain-containing protein [Blattabacterium cuenoti]|uniref:TPM domain-containing protein n=1 Tax=Blattabacterium cuenoti TaxID=1653831 RepID=UPI00163D1A0B|nr:TPM domain-containing protein [Blattabacterium cuenoti]